MIHMIDDQIEAYRRAVADTARARTMCNLNPNAELQAEFLSCLEEEQLRLDGLKSVIGMAIREYAAREPHNPFSINGDVNQPSSFICDNGMMTEPEPEPAVGHADFETGIFQTLRNLNHLAESEPTNEHGTFPPPPTED